MTGREIFDSDGQFIPKGERGASIYGLDDDTDKTYGAAAEGDAPGAGGDGSATADSDGPGDPPDTEKPSLWEQFFSAFPVIGPTVESSNELGKGNYLAGTLAFGSGLFDLFTLGASTESKGLATVGTAGVEKLSENATEKVAAKKLEIKAANGVIIKGYVGHYLERKIGTFSRKGVTSAAVINALKHPLVVKDAITDGMGRISQRFIGILSEVVINPTSGEIISVNPTSTKKAAKLLKSL